MIAVVVLAGLALLALPGLAASTAMHLPPREWRRSSRVAIGLGLVAVELGLALGAVPTVSAAAGVESVAEACHHLLGAHLPGGAATGWASASASVALLAVGGAAARRARRLRRAARIGRGLGEHRRVPGATLVVLPTDTVVAYAAPGPSPQVVVSRGLADALAPDELDAVVRHELAHLRNRHHHDLALAGVVDSTLGWIPGMRASTASLRLSVERSADEDACDRPGAREATRRALVRATETMVGAVPAFTAAGTLLARLEALAAPPRQPNLRRRLAVFGPVVALAAASGSSLLGWAVASHHGLLHVLRLCPF